MKAELIKVSGEPVKHRVVHYSTDQRLEYVEKCIIQALFEFEGEWDSFTHSRQLGIKFNEYKVCFKRLEYLKYIVEVDQDFLISDCSTILVKNMVGKETNNK